MKNIVFAFVLAMSTGCCAIFGSDEPLLREIRADIVESIRPGMVDAMDKARNPDGTHIYIEPYMDAKIELLDTTVESIDRVYPPADGEPYKPEPAPWED